MSKMNKKSMLFLSILFVICLIIVPLTLNAVNRVIIIDVIFMVGLSIFIIGGFLWIIEKGIYSRILKNFKKFLKGTSKIESYVENYDMETVKWEETQKKKHKSIPLYMITIGVALIIISSIMAIL